MNHLPKHFLLYILLLPLINYTGYAQHIPIPTEWKFAVGDGADWASPSFNDAGWRLQKIGVTLSAPGVKDNVFAWYRTQILIPDNLKSEIEKGGGIRISLGKIDDVDQLYVNGRLVGQTGTLPPNYESKWDVDRYYNIPDSLLNWNGPNCIAVRVFSMDAEGLGMVTGNYSCRPIQWFDLIETKPIFVATPNKGVITRLQFTNNSSHAFKGIVHYHLKDKANQTLFSESRPVIVPAGIGKRETVDLSNYEPVATSIFNLGYEITEEDGGAAYSYEQVYLSDRKIEIPVVAAPLPLVQNKIPDNFEAAAFKDQQFSGYLGERLKLNLEERLLKIDEEGLIAGYLQRPGNHPWIGEHVGKYLESACNAWRYTKDARLKQQMDRLMVELINSQLADGYLGTYTPDQYWTSWDLWSHKYNLYGLLAYYTTTGYKPALEACKRMGDLLCKTFGNGPGQRDIILAGEHRGMAATSVLDPMVELYKYTADKKYLDFCYYILQAWEQQNGPKIISSLLQTGKVNKVANGKAYEMLSNLVGLVKLYRLTGSEALYKPVLIAWNDIVNNRLYITGTASSFEVFQDDGKLPASNKDNMGEGCVTTTWMQLNQNLLAITGDLKYEEQIEKSVYNQLLGAENPETGCVSYYTAMMDKKPYTCEISCCTSSVPRGIAMIPYFSFGKIKNSPALLWYEPATYSNVVKTGNQQEIGIQLFVESRFPESGTTTITVNPTQQASFAILLRVPSWSRGFTARVAGKTYTGSANQFVRIERTWKPADKINISFDIPLLTVSGGISYPGQVAFTRGPQVLALDETLYKKMPAAFSASYAPAGIVNVQQLQKAVGLLPPHWKGKQLYAVKVKDGSPTEAGKELLLVPFADAGQTGEAIKVWMQLKNGDK